MSSGGLRENAGRKKIGVIVNTRIEEQIIEQIEFYIKGLSRADKIRKCLLLGIEHTKNNLDAKTFENNTATISRFYKVYSNLLSLLGNSEDENVQILNEFLIGFFTSAIPRENDINVDLDLHKIIVSELSKFSWSIDEFENTSNLITPNIVGSVIEKIVNQKETGSYYTPKDTTSYIAKYSIVFSLLCKCNLPTLAYYFYSDFNESSNVGVLNDSSNPVEKLAKAINKLNIDEKIEVFKCILNFSILDPTCGTGAFIIAAADIMVEIYKLTNMYLYISLNDFVVNMFKNCLFGVDIVESAISLIHLRCKLYLYNLGISKDIVDSIDFKFYCGDSLSPKDEEIEIKKFINWKKIFPCIENNGGFDCIIGNPPYVETYKAKIDISKYGDYKTKKCGNLYAHIFENSLNLLKDNSYMGMIVPISLTSTQRMESLRELLFDTCETIYIANFSDRPACLFTGVHQKLSIIFLKKTKPTNGCKVYTSSYLHWSKAERHKLFDSLEYCRTTKAFINSCGIAKIGNEVKLSILKKVLNAQCDFETVISDKQLNNSVFLNQRMTFWAKCFSAPESSNEYKEYYIKDSLSNKAVAALINSSLFYLIWETYSDCWHITQSDLSNLRLPQAFFDKEVQQKLKNLETNLENKLYATKEYIYSKQTDYIYIHRLCFKEITAINDFVAKIYDFSDIEKQYIQDYNTKYRLSNTKVTEAE